MTTVSIKAKEPQEQGNISHISHLAPGLPVASKQQDLTYVPSLVEATRERRLAALRISALTQQAVETIINQSERAIYPEQE